MKLTSAFTFYSHMNQWMEEIAEGTGDHAGAASVDFINQMYGLAPLPWPRLADLRKRYGEGDRPSKYTSVVNTIYGDGYDPVEEEAAANTKSRWWRLKSKRTADSSKSPAESRTHSETR